MFKKNGYWLSILIIALALCGLRLIHITADPPSDLSWSGGLFFDEGALAHNARNKVLFGEWNLDEWNDFYYSPILTYIKWIIFALFGVGMVQLRLVPILFSWLTIGTLYRSVKDSFTRTTALLSMVLFGVNYVYLMYSRLGLTEVSLAFLTVLTLYFWQRGLRASQHWHSHGFMFLAGVSCFMTYIFKALIVYFLPVPVVTLWILGWSTRDRQERQRFLILAGVFLLGMGITAGIWLLVFYYPNYEAIQQAGNYVKNLSFPRTPQDVWRNVLHTPFFSIFLQTPIELLCAWSYLIYLLYRWLFARIRLEPLDVFTSLWFLAHFTFFIAYSYRPTRYYVSIIPPMCYLAARGIVILGQPQKIRATLGKRSLVFWVGGWLLGVVLWAQILLPCYVLYGPARGSRLFVALPNRLIVGAFGSLVMMGILAWGQRYSQGRSLPWIRNVLRPLAIGLVVLSLWINGEQFYQWAMTPHYTVRNISRELGILLHDAFITGLTTPMLCIENKHRALYVWENFTNYEDPSQKYKLTHAILGEFNNEVGYYEKKFPEIMHRAVPLKTYLIKNSRFHLYSLIEPTFKQIAVNQEQYLVNEPVELNLKVTNNDPRQARDIEVVAYFFPRDGNAPIIPPAQALHVPAADNEKISFTQPLPAGTYDMMMAVLPARVDEYPAEALPSHIGQIVPDPAASSQSVRYAGQGTSGFLAYGPYQLYPPGHYEVVFALKCDLKTVSSEEQIARIDVSAEQGKTILAQKDLSAAAFLDADAYNSFTLSFALKSEQSLEFRVFTHGNTALWMDTIHTSLVRGQWYDRPIVVQAEAQN